MRSFTFEGEDADVVDLLPDALADNGRLIRADLQQGDSNGDHLEVEGACKDLAQVPQGNLNSTSTNHARARQKPSC